MVTAIAMVQTITTASTSASTFFHCDFLLKLFLVWCAASPPPLTIVIVLHIVTNCNPFCNFLG